jgi:hypothetical protein
MIDDKDIFDRDSIDALANLQEAKLVARWIREFLGKPRKSINPEDSLRDSRGRKRRHILCGL